MDKKQGIFSEKIIQNGSDNEKKLIYEVIRFDLQECMEEKRTDIKIKLEENEKNSCGIKINQEIL